VKKEYYTVTENFEITLIFKKNKDDVLELNEKETLEVFEKKIKELKRSLELLKNNVVK
jgi:CII-binding regulator of phage lambda lysogenization HflD